MNALLLPLFILLMVSAVVGLALHHSFLSQLRARHAGIWEALGRPTLFLNNNINNALAVQRFLWRREYIGLADESFVRLAAFLRTFNIAYIVLFLVIVGVFAASLGKQ